MEKPNTTLLTADGNMHDLSKRTVSEARGRWLVPCVPELRRGSPCAHPMVVLVVRIRLTVPRRRRDHGHTEEQRGNKNQFPSQEAPFTDRLHPSLTELVQSCARRPSSFARMSRPIWK